MPEIPDPESRIIVAITGPTCSGKGVVIKTLRREGFSPISMGNFLRGEAHRRGLPAEQPYLHNIVYEMLAKDATVLAKQVINEIRESVGQLIVIDGVRTLPTISKLRKEEKGITVLGLNAPREILVERILDRKRPGDPKTPEEAYDFLEREWGESEPSYGYRVRECLQMSDERIESVGTLDELDEKVMRFLKKLKASRP